MKLAEIIDAFEDAASFVFAEWMNDDDEQRAIAALREHERKLRALVAKWRGYSGDREDEWSMGEETQAHNCADELAALLDGR